MLPAMWVSVILVSVGFALDAVARRRQDAGR